MVGVIAAEVPKIHMPEVVWSALAPQLFLMIGGVVLLTIVSLVQGRLFRGAYCGYTVLVGLATLASLVPLWHRVRNAKEGVAVLVGGAVSFDAFSLFAIGVIAVGLILAALTADGYLRREGLEGPELFVLMMLSASGGSIMVAANDLIVLFIGLEILSIAAYILAAMHSRRVSSQESGLKYFVLGAFASAFLLYGIALVYGATGSTNLSDIQGYLSEVVLLKDGLLLAGLGMLLVGFGFKVAAAPFHNWTPDVYQGAPSPVTGFMATVVKTAGFAAMIRVIVVTFDAYSLQWKPVVFALATLSLLVGSFTALAQSNVKRMLAYSSINHAGFLLVGVQAGRVGTSAVLFYLAAYTLLAAGSFAVVSVVGGRGDSRHGIEDYDGLSRIRPTLAAAFTVLLLAQAGVPFTGGFLAKLGVIRAAAESHNWALAVIAMLSAVVSAFLYLRIVVHMYFHEPADSSVRPSGVAVGTRIALALAVVGTVALGVVPGPVTSLAKSARPVLVALGR